MKTTIHDALCVLRYRRGWTVKQVAEMAGCSTALVYTWYEADGYATPDGHYLFALAATLADRGDTYLIEVLLPADVRLVHRDDEDGGWGGPNGSVSEEVGEGVVALGRATVSEQARDATGLFEAADGLERAARGLRMEGQWLLGAQGAA